MLARTVDGAGSDGACKHAPYQAVVFGVTFLGETPSPRLGIALVMILFALTVAQSRLGLRRGGQVKG